MEKKSKIFQPKVIIGSIASFVVAAVGIIAVFFPNLFNLEKSSMGEGQFLLSEDESSHRKLWQFLEDNQGKVVQLEIAYCADFERMNFAVQNEKISMEFQAINFIPRWYFGFGGEREWRTYGVSEYLKKFAKQNKASLKYIEGLTQESVADFYGEFNKNLCCGDKPITSIERTYYLVNEYELLQATFNLEKMLRPPTIAGEIASFVTYHYGNDIHPDVYGLNIQNGGIGFTGAEFDDKRARNIQISHPSNKNKKYIWVVGFENAVYKYLDKTSSLAKRVKKTCKAKQFQQDMLNDDVSAKDELLRIWGGATLGYIKGVFYIHEKEEVEDSDGNIALWRFFEIEIEDENYFHDKFELEPFDKKDIELRKY